MKHLILLTGLFMLAGCGGSGDSTTAPRPSLFKIWNYGSNQHTLNLASGVFNGAFQGSYYWPTLGTCECTFTLNGNNASGTFVQSACFFKENAPFDCSNFNGWESSYTNDGTTLEVCDLEGCLEYN